MEMPMDLLRTFVAAADSRGFTAAAAVVNRTQSAVSMQMKRLEEELGRVLFRRNGRAMELTPEGDTLLGYARRILKLHDEALAAVARPEVSGHVRLGAPVDYAERLLPLILARFAESHPLVRVEVRCERTAGRIAALRAGELDLAIHAGSGGADEGESFHREPVVWISSKEHLAHEQDPLPLAVYHETCIYRQWALDALKAKRRDYRIAYTSPSISAILAAVKGGLAVAPVGLYSITEDLRVLGPEDGFPLLPEAVVSLAMGRGPHSAAVETLARHVRECFLGLNSI